MKGLHAEYDRLSSQQTGNSKAGADSSEKKLKADLEAAASKLEEAEVCYVIYVTPTIPDNMVRSHAVQLPVTELSSLQKM